MKALLMVLRISLERTFSSTSSLYPVFFQGVVSDERQRRKTRCVKKSRRGISVSQTKRYRTQCRPKHWVKPFILPRLYYLQVSRNRSVNQSRSTSFYVLRQNYSKFVYHDIHLLVRKFGIFKNKVSTRRQSKIQKTNKRDLGTKVNICIHTQFIYIYTYKLCIYTYINLQRRSQNPTVCKRYLLI